jgi:hypothetical protein
MSCISLSKKAGKEISYGSGFLFLVIYKKMMRTVSGGGNEWNLYLAFIDGFMI